MTSPFRNTQNHNTRPSILPDLLYPRSSYASIAAASPRPTSGTQGGGSRTQGPSSFSHILNPVDSDWDSQYLPPVRSHHGLDDMTQNGSNLDGGAGSGGLYQTRSQQQLPPFSRAFEMFMSRTTLDNLPGTDPFVGGRASSSSSGGSSFPRPSYLQGSNYLARLEQQTQQKAAAQREKDAELKNASNAASQGNKTASSQAYLGLTYDVIERTPPHEEEDAVDPLPTRWGTGKDDKASGLEVLSDGLEVKYTGPRNQNEREHEACAIRADHTMPVQCGLYYFEVTILSKRHNDTIGIGFSSKTVALNRAPGWEPESWGYHGDDGHCFASQSAGKHYGPTFTTGDTIGCGVNFGTGTAFFTKNGKDLDTAFREVRGKLYPSVGMKKPGEHVRVNFGQTPFKEIQQLEEQIAQADTSKLAPPLDETEVIQQLVLQFLQHDGYVDTARAFAKELQTEKQALCLDPNTEVPGIDIRDDQDANNRQQIRRAILEGDIDKAIKHTNLCYAHVLEENEQVYFRLRCRKFIELIRREAEMNMVGGGGPKGTHAVAASNNGHGQSLPGEDMELDEEMEDLDTSLDVRDLAQDALQYGQALQAEFADDERKEVRAALKDIFGLMAYQNPLKESKLSYLLDRKGRVAVAEELNSAILQSLGKSSRAALENVYAQTSVLLDELAEAGGPGAFVTLQGIIDDIPVPSQRL
ncbi:Ran-binding protein 10 [Cytospora mali]|uniref:Ran-binding protein 10 n=1 Tax=Cytospora mali TaxID=578113 RepID=A0A194WCD9_CYTMA|nr:Ran-binding protein 10 [Valsa mali]